MNAVPSRRYLYTVTAVDRSGNESAASAAVSGTVPAESQQKSMNRQSSSNRRQNEAAFGVSRTGNPAVDLLLTEPKSSTAAFWTGVCLGALLNAGDDRCACRGQPRPKVRTLRA